MTATSRIFIETMVRRAIHNVEDSPKRTLRNLVDLALQFSNGRFQTHFFQYAQTLLKDENSTYYDLFYDIITHVDEERLINFGMNIGYNSCTLGAKRIRELKTKHQIHIPWSKVLHINHILDYSSLKQYHTIIEEGKGQGIYTWQCHMKMNPELLLPLVAKHPDCAFVLFCSPSSVTNVLIDGVQELNHLMLAVRYEDGVDDVCRNLREHHLLYSLYYEYVPDDTDQILNDDLFYSIQQLHPFCIAMRSNANCNSELTNIIYKHIQDIRLNQTIQAIPWELEQDCQLVDTIISSCQTTSFLNKTKKEV